MAKKCTNWVCPYCMEIVRPRCEDQDDSQVECCDEVHAYECGDEGRLCPECEEKRDEEMQAHFGIRPGMTREQRRAQLEVFRPVETITEAEWAEWRKLK